MDDHRPLPEDLLVDILLRLPVKSLLLFKCVSKRWYALIKSPSFIEKHFHHRNNRARLLICNLKLSFERNVALQSVDFSLLPNKIVPGVTAEPKPLYQLEKVTGFTCFVGPVDGLFLVQKDLYRDNVRLALWNPATREFWPLPPAPFEIENFLTDHDHQFGLGFDQVSKDYKVVWIRVFWDELGQGVYPRVYASVYSLCNNTWKNLSPEFQSSCTLSASLNATYLNGFYYWLSRGLDEIYNVRSFDIGNEQFGEIRGPDIPSEQCGTLLLHGESLAMLAGYPGTSVYDLWVMIQEGNWTKVLTVQPLINANWPRGIWENDKMIFDITETSQLVLYDNTTKDVTELGYQQDPSFERCWVFNYKESLVPIKRENDTWDQDNVVELIDHFFPTL